MERRRQIQRHKKKRIYVRELQEKLGLPWDSNVGLHTAP